MRPVNFNEIEAGANRPGCGDRERLKHVGYLGRRHLSRYGPSFRHRDRTGGQRFPGLRRIEIDEWRSAVQWHRRAGFAARMTDLDTDWNSLLMVHRGDSGQALDMAVEIDSQTTRRDTAIACYRRSLHTGATDAGQRETPVMCKMPGDRVAVFGTILTHRRNQDAVVECHAAQRERCKYRG